MPTLVQRWVPIRQKRPYKSLAEFCEKQGCLGRKLDHGEYPCLTCRGRRWVYDPNDPPCPIEGNKMRNTLKCDACAGTGRSTRKACAAAYQKVIDEWKKEVTEYDRLEALRKSAIEKLTADEIHAIQELGL